MLAFALEEPVAASAFAIAIATVRPRAHESFARLDSGEGIDRAIRARLFEPLVTTKAKGIGLGLALVKRIVERERIKAEIDAANALASTALACATAAEVRRLLAT